MFDGEDFKEIAWNTEYGGKYDLFKLAAHNMKRESGETIKLQLS